jgi:hypothetical protein
MAEKVPVYPPLDTFLAMLTRNIEEAGQLMGENPVASALLAKMGYDGVTELLDIWKETKITDPSMFSGNLVARLKLMWYDVKELIDEFEKMKEPYEAPIEEPVMERIEEHLTAAKRRITESPLFALQHITVAQNAIAALLEGVEQKKVFAEPETADRIIQASEAIDELMASVRKKPESGESLEGAKRSSIRKWRPKERRSGDDVLLEEIEKPEYEEWGDILHPFMDGYLAAALWSSFDEAENPLDDKYSTEHLSEHAIRTSVKESVDFIKANAKDMEASGAPPEQHGHDFWLTRNGHGAGFWDRGYGAVGDRLSEAARPYGEVNIFVETGPVLEMY